MPNIGLGGRGDKNVHWSEIKASVPKEFIHGCRFRALLCLVG